MEIIRFEHVNVAYENENVLHDIHLSIKEGEHTAILGANIPDTFTKNLFFHTIAVAGV
jgi:ABC-type branched-subunit amino acid transport system ATPase component